MPKPKLKFKIIKKDKKARAGKITLNNTTLTTPVFMPVGTKATIKGMILDLLQNPKYIGNDLPPIKMILANTYHLFLRPGDQIIKKNGGLHKFENRDDLILTDSGGFQVFSLGDGNENNNLVNIVKDGVHFKSPIDGSKQFFTPEKVVDIQTNLGSDIMMMLDVCSPVQDTSKQKVANQMETTHRWAKKAYNYFMPKYKDHKGVLFPIIQGGVYKDLREKSVDTIKQYAQDGIAIGGLSVGESKDQLYDTLDFLSNKLPEDKPRYLMGVGTPKDLRKAIYKGVDMFDCVLPTRLGRHGTAFGPDGDIRIRNAEHKDSLKPLTDDCSCFVCQNFTRSYLSHLIRQNEMLGGVLLSLHNISYLHKIVNEIRKDILSK